MGPGCIVGVLIAEARVVSQCPKRRGKCHRKDCTKPSSVFSNHSGSACALPHIPCIRAQTPSVHNHHAYQLVDSNSQYIISPRRTLPDRPPTSGRQHHCRHFSRVPSDRTLVQSESSNSHTHPTTSPQTVRTNDVRGRDIEGQISVQKRLDRNLFQLLYSPLFFKDDLSLRRAR